MSESRVDLDLDESLWERVFTIAPVVVVGTREADGSFDLAPKHLALPMGWGPWFGFVCAPHHATYRNVVRERAFSVSWPRPDQLLIASLSASPRCDDGSKPVTGRLPTVPARAIDGVLLRDAYLHAECELHQVIEGFDRNALVTGRVVAATADVGALRGHDRDDGDLLYEHPLLALVYPGRFARVDRTEGFPLPAGYSR